MMLLEKPIFLSANSQKSSKSITTSGCLQNRQRLDRWPVLFPRQMRAIIADQATLARSSKLKHFRMHISRILAAVGLTLLLVRNPAHGEDAGPKLTAIMNDLRLPGIIHSAVGVTRKGTSIPCVLSPEDLDFATRKTRVLLVAGFDSSPVSVANTLAAVRWFYTSPDAKTLRERYVLSAVPCGNPDGWAAVAPGDNGSGGHPDRGYPPKGESYGSPTDPESAYLWRWIGMHAPDIVVEVTAGEALAWHLPATDPSKLVSFATALRPQQDALPPDSLASALVRDLPCNTGSIPAIRVSCPKETAHKFLLPLFDALSTVEFKTPSPARQQLQQRLNRTPLEVATQFSKRYGHDLSEVVYIPAVALIGRIRLGELTNDSSHLADVQKIVEPFVSGKKLSLTQKPSGSHLSGHLVFGVLADATKDPRYLERVRAAANFGFDSAGKPLKVMPFHNEMSDAVFMGGPILAQAGRLTGEQKYYDMCLQNMRFMCLLNVRKDGLHRHSPLDETAWGRGNGFPALGLALSLSDLPADDSGREEMLTAFRAHLSALSKHQDPTGCWHQVINKPESYRELSCTCMITFAMARGIRLGWLDRATYEPLVERGWYAIRTRVAPDGGLVDICTGTGKQKSLRDYYDRPAILGPDARGGAMALLIATEMALYQQSNP
jgi:unsaturated rhamnogalacturonyl hydrolase